MGCKFLCCAFSILFLFHGWAYGERSDRQDPYRFVYVSQEGKRMELVFRDSFSVEKAGYSLSVFRKEQGSASEELVFCRDSSFRSFSLCTDAQMPHEVECCGKKYLSFWMESCRTDVTLLNSMLWLELLPLEEGVLAEACLEGRRKNVAKTVHSKSTERCFMVEALRCLPQDLCVRNVVEAQYVNIPYLTSYGDRCDGLSVGRLPLENPLNYSVAWLKENGVVALSDVDSIKFVYYDTPFFPLRPTRSMENEFFKVVAFPYGDVLAFDKRRKKYFVVWASDYLPREDYSKTLAWKEHSSKELKMQGVYDQEIYYLNLETGVVSK